MRLALSRFRNSGKISCGTGIDDTSAHANLVYISDIYGLAWGVVLSCTTGLPEPLKQIILTVPTLSFYINLSCWGCGEQIYSIMKRVLMIVIVLLQTLFISGQTVIEQYECVFPQKFIFQSTDKDGYNVTKNFTVEAATLTYKSNKIVTKVSHPNK